MLPRGGACTAVERAQLAVSAATPVHIAAPVRVRLSLSIMAGSVRPIRRSRGRTAFAGFVPAVQFRSQGVLPSLNESAALTLQRARDAPPVGAPCATGVGLRSSSGPLAQSLQGGKSDSRGGVSGNVAAR